MSILRDIFLKMSTSARMHDFVVRFPLSRRVSRRFVAGETLDEAIQVVKTLNAQGLGVTFDQLGESVSQAESAKEAERRKAYQEQALSHPRVKEAIEVFPEAKDHINVRIDTTGR